MFDLWTVILSSGALLGFFLSLTLFFHKRGNRRSNIMLSFLILVMSVFLAEYVFFRTGLAVKYKYYISASIPLAYLIGPLFYFYTRTLLDPQDKIPVRALLHLAPAVLCFVNIFPDLLFIAGILKDITDTDQLFIIFIGPYIYLFSALIQTSVYFYISLKFIKEFEKNTNRPSKIGVINSAWLKRLTFIFIAFLAVEFLTFLVLLMLPAYITEIEYAFSLVSASIIFVTGFFSIRQPEIISGIYTNGNSKKYEKSGLNTEQSGYYVKELLRLMEEEKPYLNEELKLNLIAEKLSISPTYLSQVINQELDYNFFDFVNKYRIEEVKKRIDDPSFSHYTLLGIALECGFSNKTSFNRAFKKFTGLTPSEYQKSILKEKTFSKESLR